MLKRLFTSALFAGFAGGLIFALLQISLLSPIIIEAEAYESGAKYHFEGVADRPMADHMDGHSAMAAANDAAHAAGEAPVMEPEESWAARSTRTALSSILTALGFAFLLAAAFGMAERAGIQISARTGILWGLAGFAGIPLATSLGLPPELPGSVSAALESRQLWWVATAGISVLGIAALAFGKNWVHWARVLPCWPCPTSSARLTQKPSAALSRPSCKASSSPRAWWYPPSAGPCLACWRATCGRANPTVGRVGFHPTTYQAQEATLQQIALSLFATGACIRAGMRPYTSRTPRPTFALC